MKYFFLAMLLFAFALGISSCNDDEDTTGSTISSVFVKDLAADPTTGFDPNTGMPIGDKKIFTFFRLADSSIVPNTDSATTKWDIGFRGSTIIINGGSSGPGQGGAFIFSGLFSDLKEVPADSTFRVDQSLSNTAIGKGWYDYNGAAMVFTPKPGKVLVIRTADNKFAKLEILSYYKNAPANPTLNDPARYFTFRYVYQADGTKKF